MTVEERLARVEAILIEQKEDIGEIRRRVDGLVEAAHMGRGAWWLIMRFGAILAALLGAVGWIGHGLHR